MKFIKQLLVLGLFFTVQFLPGAAMSDEPVELMGNASQWKKIPGMEILDAHGNLDILIQGNSHQARWIDLPDGTVLLRLKMTMQCFDVVPDKQSWQNARLGMSFHDSTGKRVGKWPNIFWGSGNTKQMTCLRDFPVPETATRLLLTPANYGISGRVEFRGVSLLAYTKSALQAEKKVREWRNPDFSHGLSDWNLFRTQKNLSIETNTLIYTPTTQERSRIGQRRVLAAGKDYFLLAEISAKSSACLKATSTSVRYSRPLIRENILNVSPGRHRYILPLEALPFTISKPGDLAIEITSNGRLQIHKLELKACDFTRKELPFSKNWNVFVAVNEKPLITDRIPEFIRNEKGEKISARKMILPVGLREKGRTVDFKWIMRKTPDARGVAVMYNEFESPEDAEVLFGCSADWYYQIYLNGILVCDRMSDGNRIQDYTPNANRLYLPVRKGRNLFVAVIRRGSRGWKFNWGVPLEPKAPLIFQENQVFRKVDLSDLEVRKGSALDLSFLNADNAPAGKSGRLKVNSDGSAGFERTSTPFRFQGYTSDLQKPYWTVRDRKTFNENARRLAEAMNRQGYNLFRMHGIDLWVMEGARKDLEPSTEFFDRWDRLLYEMKLRGIYTQYVVFSFNLYSGENGWKTHFPLRNIHRLMLYCGREWERERFRRGAELMLNHRNPYTGLRWKDDPAIVLVEFYNEQSSGFLLQDLKNDPEACAYFLNCWKKWVRTYLKDQSRSAHVQEKTRQEGLNSPPDPRRLETGEWRNIFALFRQDLQKTCHEWCAGVLRDAGYRGLFTNTGTPLVNWQTVPVCDSHTYYNHPTQWENKGSRVRATSNVAEEAPSIRGTTARRLAGRPYFIGEYNFCFWNPYQRELPLAFNAYAAFQGYSSLAIHDQAVALGSGQNSRLTCFHAGISPIQRAGEFLSVLFFRRRDVKESPHRVQLQIGRNFLHHPVAMGKAVSGEQSRLALLTGFSLAFPDTPKYPDLPPIPKPDCILSPDGASEIYEEGWFSTDIESAKRQDVLKRLVETLRKKGILSRENPTDPDAGIFQTDTGEITLRSKESLIKVVTPRSEAVSLRGGAKPERLHALTIQSVSTDALVGLAAVDTAVLPDSKRMVLVFATENVNTSMILEGDRETLIEPGHAPILLRTGTLSIRFRNSNKSLKLYALRLNGTRSEELPLSKKDGEWSAEIDTAKLAGGPTVFFEIVQEKP